MPTASFAIASKFDYQNRTPLFMRVSELELSLPTKIVPLLYKDEIALEMGLMAIAALIRGSTS